MLRASVRGRPSGTLGNDDFIPAWNWQLESGVLKANYLRFSLRGGVFNPKVKAASALRIPDAPFLIGREHDKGNALGPESCPALERKQAFSSLMPS